ncbi:MAG: hypothetical protein GYB66_04015 [Chloroflexi bacterium]|nr:hypothetical protein [Chloroflexota bacterium]
MNDDENTDTSHDIQQDVPRRLALRDLVWIALFLGLLGGAALLLWLDQGNVSIDSYGPTGLSSSNAVIEISFGATMDRESVEDRFSIAPGVTGGVEWQTDRTLRYVPSEPLIPDQRYEVRIEPGARSLDGERTLESALVFEFRVKWPSIVFLGPSTAAVTDLMRLDPQTGAVDTLTNSEGGVVDFAISPDGEWIAYSERRSGTRSEIRALNLTSRQDIQMTNCIDAQATCRAPSWRADSRQITYTRRELDQDSTWANTERIWSVDLQSRQSQLLFDDPGIEAHYARWSPVGERIALALADPPGVLVYDFPSESSIFMPSEQGLVGQWSRDGQALTYPVLQIGGAIARSYTHIELARFGDFSDEQANITSLSGERETPVEDIQASFRPNSTQLALTRRYLDSRFTEGTQVFLADTATGEVEELIYNPEYSHGAISWSQEGNLLLMQRSHLASPDRHIELWVYVMSTGDYRMIHDNGYLPQFLP